MAWKVAVRTFKSMISLFLASSSFFRGSSVSGTVSASGAACSEGEAWAPVVGSGFVSEE